MSSTPLPSPSRVDSGARVSEARLPKDRARRVPTGWAPVDAVVEGLERGVLHEWCGLFQTEAASSCPARTPWTPPGSPARTPWLPPLRLLMHLAARGVTEGGVTKGGMGARLGRAVWIGRRVWPYPPALLLQPTCACLAEQVAAGGSEFEDDLVRRWAAANPLRPCAEHGRDLLAHSVFLDPPDDKARLRAIDLCVRCPSVDVVVADGQGLRMGHTRRLQLAARDGNALVLLARPPAEAREISAASTRWDVRRMPLPTDRADEGGPRWEVSLRRHKEGGGHKQGAGTVKTGGAGTGGSEDYEGRVVRASQVWALGRSEGAGSARRSGRTTSPARRWMLEWNDAAGVVGVVADVVHRPVPATSGTGT